MKVNDVLRKGEIALRILVIKDDRCFCINCNAESMPAWMPKNSLEDYIPDTAPMIDRNMTARQKQVAHERFTMIASMLVFLTDDKERNRIMNRISEEQDISKQTLRRYLCRYLVYQDIAALAPAVRESKQELSQDQKNMRWALNKYFYTPKKSKLTDVYVKLLKEKYCDPEGNLPAEYPSMRQFRYFEQKYRKQENYLISRNGLKNYQRNDRPLLGEGVQEYAPCIGVGMLDATVCDIYLVNKEGLVVGRPILVAGVDANTSLCLGYLKGGSCVVAYNPDDVSHVWLRTDNGYEEFQIIETMYTGKSLEQVSEIKKGQEAIVRNEAEEALQAKIRLMSFIETAVSVSGS